jgi:hypothetical protein
MSDPVSLAADAAVAAIEAGPPVTATAKTIAAAAGVATANSMTIEIFGYHFNLIAIMITVILAMVMILFYKIQKSQKLDFADMITKDGRAVSLTKVLQLIGGLTATWVMIKLTLTGGLTEALFGLYLTYVGAIEAYSKFVAAKYGYQEKSVKDAAIEAGDATDTSADTPDPSPQKQTNTK